MVRLTKVEYLSPASGRSQSWGKAGAGTDATSIWGVSEGAKQQPSDKRVISNFYTVPEKRNVLKRTALTGHLDLPFGDTKV